MSYVVVHSANGVDLQARVLEDFGYEVDGAVVAFQVVKVRCGNRLVVHRDTAQRVGIVTPAAIDANHGWQAFAGMDVVRSALADTVAGPVLRQLCTEQLPLTAAPGQSPIRSHLAQQERTAIQ